MKVISGKRGAELLVYSCNNKETGCSYKVESTTMIQAQVIGIRPDGTDIR